MDIIIKPSSLVDIENTLTLAQRKILNVLIEHSREHIHKSEIYSINVRTLREKAGAQLFESNSDVFEQVKAITELPAMEANLFGKDKKYPTRVIVNLIAQASYDKNSEIIAWAYPPFIRDMLRGTNTSEKSELGMYVRLPLAIQSKFSSKHSLALWEFFRSRYDEKRGYAESPYIEIAELNKLFHCNYGSWNALNKNILRIAIQDIHTHEPDYRIDVRIQKARHKVIAAKFILQKKNDAPEKIAQEPVQHNNSEKILSKSEQKKDARLEAFYAALSHEEQARIEEQIEKQIPDFVLYPASESQHASYRILYSIIRRTILSHLFNISET